MFLEAPDDWIEKIYVAESMLEDEEVMKKVRRFSWDAVENGVFGRCVIHRRHRESLPYSTAFLRTGRSSEEEKPLLMVLEDLQDPEMQDDHPNRRRCRSEWVFLTKTCVDITNPKVIRATMGSVYRIPFFYVEDVVSLKQKLQGRGIRFFCRTFTG